ncbi:hypothetical protein FB45DRAFT_1115966 [Roridomyces roridus]|uniref:F-box domain-containing protein n=1 Tax=Roridomyces roridus TaxID=1738132 RepID=A0AAD7FV33_9AGAR|nr:hypothetical protein FB45DRAFT_1115966 [Roridomyces roridus]
MLGTRLRSILEEIDQRILLHEEQIALLRAMRHSTARELDAIVYPVLILPSEIPSEIFIHYVESHPTRNSMRLTWVCQSWRTVAISTCQLWTQCMDLYTTSALQIWLSRAGDLPLNLDFQATLGISSEGHDIAYHTISRFSSQLKTLTLSTLAGSITIPPRPFPRLEKLSIDSENSGDEDDDDDETSAPRLDAPRLREVVLNNAAVKQLQATLPKRQLTKLDLTADLGDCLAFLRHTPNLQELAIDSSDFDHGALVPVTLPRLRSIHIGLLTSPEMLRYLTLPVLDRLSISVYVGSDETSASVNYMLERSGCTLRQLDLSLHHTDSEWLDDFLDFVSLPSLRELTLRAPDGTYGALNNLLRNVAQNRTLPALESLVIHECQFHVDLTKFVDMLAARTKNAPGVARLKSFQLSFGVDPVQGGRRDYVEIEPSNKADRDVKDSLEKLHKLRAQGLQVDIRSDFKTLNSGKIDSGIIEGIRADHEF